MGSVQVNGLVQNYKKCSDRNARKQCLPWVPERSGVKGNERADAPAREDSATELGGPEPVIGFPLSAIHRVVNEHFHSSPGHLKA